SGPCSVLPGKTPRHPEPNASCRIDSISRGGLCRSTSMRPPTAVSLDITQFPLTLAAGLRMEFAEVACAPMPQELAVLLCRLADDGAGYSGDEGNGTRPAETSRRVARGGRRRVA